MTFAISRWLFERYMMQREKRDPIGNILNGQNALNIMNKLVSRERPGGSWHQSSSKPLRNAIATACVRSLARNLPTKFLTWKLTVVSAMDKRNAICLFR